MKIPPEYIMKQMASLAMEQATTFFAKQARDFADSGKCDMITGTQALRLFADSIESTNARQYPAGDVQ